MRWRKEPYKVVIGSTEATGMQNAREAVIDSHMKDQQSNKHF